MSITGYFSGAPNKQDPLRKQNLQSQAQDTPFGRNLEMPDILPPNLSEIDGGGLSFQKSYFITKNFRTANNHEPTTEMEHVLTLCNIYLK